MCRQPFSLCTLEDLQLNLEILAMEENHHVSILYRVGLTFCL